MHKVDELYFISTTERSEPLNAIQCTMKPTILMLWSTHVEQFEIEEIIKKGRSWNIFDALNSSSIAGSIKNFFTRCTSISEIAYKLQVWDDERLTSEI